MSDMIIDEDGTEHGLVNTIANSSKDNSFKHMTPENKTKAEKQKKEDEKIVKVRYINHRERNGILEVPYSQWAGIPIKFFKLLNGREYDVPHALIAQVNDAIMPQRSEVLDKNGQPTLKDGSPDRVHELLPTRF